MEEFVEDYLPQRYTTSDAQAAHSSRRGAIKEAAYKTTIPTDFIYQDRKYCRQFVETPDMRV